MRSAFLRRGTRGSPSRRLQRTTQSGMKPASARALSFLPAIASASTSTAYRRRKAPTATSDHVRRFIRPRLALGPGPSRVSGQVGGSRRRRESVAASERERREGEADPGGEVEEGDL